MAESFIKLYRKMLDWEWYTDTNTFCIFLHCLLMANWKEGRFMGHKIPRGSFVSSYPQLASQTNMSIQNVRTAVNHLKLTGELTVKSHAKFSIFTVVNYNRYQDDNRQANRQLTDNQQTTNSQLTTIEEYKEYKNSNKGKKYYDDEALNSAFSDYVDMRKQIKKPMTDRAITLAQNKLDDLSGGDSSIAIEILNQSVLNGWQGLFPLKAESKSQEIDWSKV